MSRFKAFAIHLGISFVIFIVLAYLVVFEWYPGILFETDGGWRGMRIIIGVDLVLGPTLTLVAYKAGKPGLKFDLTFIGLLQTVCLVAGTYVVWDERPLAVVYVDSRFEVLTRDDFKTFDFKVPDFEGYHTDEEGVKWVMVRLPEDVETVGELRRKMFGLSAPLTTVAEFYEPFNSTDPLFVNQGRDMSRPMRRQDWPAAEADWLARHGGSMDDYNFYTFSTRYVYRYIGFRRDTGENLGFLELQPR
ncbi:MAG: hypothetical protein RIC89_14200 [Pseudomonadales bacterium]